MIALLRKERVERERQSRLQSHLTSALPKMRDEVVRELIELPYDPYRETRILHRLRTLELDWLLRGHLALLLVEVDDLKSNETRDGSRLEKELILFGIGNVAKQTLEEDMPHQSVLAPDQKNRWAIVLECPEDGWLEACKELAELLIRRVNRYVKVNVSVAISSGCGDTTRLHALYQEAEDILMQKAVYGGNRTLTSLGWENEAERAQGDEAALAAFADASEAAAYAQPDLAALVGAGLLRPQGQLTRVEDNKEKVHRLYYSRRCARSDP